MRVIVATLAVLVVLNVTTSAQDFRWRATEICKSCRPLELLFTDSLHGFVIAENAVLLRRGLFVTQDGGKTFDSVRGFDWNRHDYGLGNLTCPATGYIVTSGSGAHLESTDTGKTWHTYQVGLGSGFEGIFDSGRAILLTPGPGLYYVVLHSTDSGRSYEWKGGNEPQIEQPIDVAFGADGRHIAIVGQYPKTYLKLSTDNGDTWHAVFPIDTSSDSVILFRNLAVERDFVALMGGARRSGTHGDYALSTDRGDTWVERRGLVGPRISRMSILPDGSMRALIGRVSPGAKYTALLNGQTNGVPNKFIDSIFYSRDTGRTWVKDGNTFANDTVVEMQWLTPTNGMVLGYREGNSYLWRTEPMLSVEHQTRIAYPINDLQISPNPATEHLSFTNSFGGNGFEIYDAFGEKVLYRQLNVSSNETVVVDLPHKLPTGMYYLRVVGAVHPTGQWFVKVGTP